ncbi:MAG: hypothetical protein ABI914_03510 [Acidobacteriota bacterium]
MRILRASAPTLAAAFLIAAHAPAASRPPVPGCAREKLSDPAVGLEVAVQRSDFGFRKVDFLFQGSSLAIRYSDGGAPDAVIDVLNLLPGESPEAPEVGVKRLFSERTEAAVAKRCVMAPYRGSRSAKGVGRFTFVPDASYQKELDVPTNPDEVGDPPRGGLGRLAGRDPVFEAQPGSLSRRVLFARVGQDKPLFDEQGLRLIGPSAPRHR